MQFSNLFTILAVAMTATALPTAEEADNVLDPRGRGGNGNSATQCSGDNNGGRKTVCCTGDYSCIVAVNTCSSGDSVWCCKTEQTVSFPAPFIDRQLGLLCSAVSDLLRRGLLTSGCVRVCIIIEWLV